MEFLSFSKAQFDFRNNAFDFMRLFLAMVVVYAHSWKLDESIQSWMNPVIKVNDMYSGILPHGQLAVYGFFVISGFLITGSWLKSGDIKDYLAKRFLRIYPAFFVCLVLTAFVFVPILYFLTYGTMSGFGSKYLTESTRYVLDNMQITINKATIFDDSITGNYKNLNGPLWTLIFEVKVYILVVIIGLLGFFRRKWLLILTFGLFWGVYAISVIRPEFKDSLSRLTGDYKIFNLFTYFLAGTVFWVFKHKIIWDWKILVINVLALLKAIHSNMFYAVAPISFTYIILFASTNFPIRNLARKIGDLSYGVYIYSWFVQLVMNKFDVFNRFGFVIYFLLNAFFSLILGYLSWNLVEKRFLVRKNKELH
jgi:peptidoglycan/LPS O-acetylase OafA/YrhL